MKNMKMKRQATTNMYGKAGLCRALPMDCSRPLR